VRGVEAVDRARHPGVRAVEVVLRQVGAHRSPEERLAGGAVHVGHVAVLARAHGRAVSAEASAHLDRAVGEVGEAPLGVGALERELVGLRLCRVRRAQRSEDVGVVRRILAGPRRTARPRPADAREGGVRDLVARRAQERLAVIGRLAPLVIEERDEVEGPAPAVLRSTTYWPPCAVAPSRERRQGWPGPRADWRDRRADRPGGGTGCSSRPRSRCP
jgi:hypothetical protein